VGRGQGGVKPTRARWRTFAEAIPALEDPAAIEEDDPTDLANVITIGRSLRDRVLYVVTTGRRERTRIIGARIANTREKDRYEASRKEEE
jgi:uncharacterized DUF497 family protein